jgi:hypothetical protein
MKHCIVYLAAVLLAAVVAATPGYAATEAAKDAAISDALAYLAGTQQGNGAWNYGDDNYDCAATAAALLAFIEEGHTPTSGTAYSTVVASGVDFIMSRATNYSIGAAGQPGNPDTNGNGIGVKFVPGGDHTRDTYVTGLVLPVIASLDPAGVANTGTQAGRSYFDIAQDTCDYFAFGQANPGNNARGGWRYYADYGQADNSTAQWPVIGMLYAQGKMGCTVPGFVKDELAHWTGYIQNANGGSGYDSPTSIVNESKTGGLLVEMLFAGDDTGGVPYDINHPNVQAALNYLNNNWQDGPSGTWDGNFGHPYAMWSIYKGLEVYLGTDGADAFITDLHPAGPIDAGDEWNWWEDYCEWLVNNQNANGSWSGYSNWTGPMATGWNVNILNATFIPPPPPPDPIPEPLTLLGLVIGGGSLGGYLRRRRA